MNSLPGLLVEYFISGVVALIWIATAFFPNQVEENANRLFLLIPIVYILGMFIDVLAYLLTYYPKNWVRNYVNFKARDKNSKVPLKELFKSKAEEFKYNLKPAWTGNEMKVLIASEYPELRKELTTRSSRDRICRGMVVNAMGMTVFLPQCGPQLGLGIVLISLIMWVIFEQQSHKYFLSACRVIEKLQTSASHPSR